MPDTYTQLHIQLVFAVKYRQALIEKAWKDELDKYTTGIIQSNGHKLLQINSMPDHTHILLGMRPNQAISSLVQNVKAETTKWIQEKKFCSKRFAWQNGFGAFSYSKSHVENVVRYIKNQEAHHAKQKFLDEYREILRKFGVPYDEQYIFQKLL